MSARRSLQRLLLAIVSGAFTAGAIAVGCATGSDQPPEVPAAETGPATDSSFAEVGGDSTTDTKGGDTKTGDTKPLFDSDLFCGDIGAPNTCDRVIDLGAAPLGGSGATKGNLPLTGGDLWYKATFEGLDNPTAHPKIVLEGADSGLGFRFEILKSCAREAFTCGATEDASTSKLTEFENAYEDTSPLDDADGGDGFAPISLGPGGVVYIRVYRTAGTPTNCDGFTLKISN